MVAAVDTVLNHLVDPIDYLGNYEYEGFAQGSIRQGDGDECGWRVDFCKNGA